MGLFDGIANTVGGMFGGGQDFNPLDAQSYKQYETDVGGVRNLATTPVTGLDVGGQATSDLANTVYGNQLDQMNRQAMSNLATGQAGVQRYGADAGSMERLAGQNMRQQLIGQQGLGQTNMQNQADIASRNIGQQLQNQNTALMALPQMSAMPFQTEVTANASNQQANAAQMQGLGSMAGMALGASGGPMGMALGSALGGQVGGLFG